jgi:FkbM family methyltransferase
VSATRSPLAPIVRWWHAFRAQTISVGAGKGLRFLFGPSNPDYVTGNNELPVQEALVRTLRPGQVFFDVGANVGFFAVIGARLVGPRGKVVAFEPVGNNAALVRQNAAINGFGNLEVVEKAVAAVSGRAKLALAAYAGGSSLAHVGTPPDATGAMLPVETVALDDLIFSQRHPAPDLVKIDVEGAEREVLEGMARLLRQVRPIVLYEIDDADRAVMTEKREVCRALLRSAGYHIVALPESYAGSGWHVGHDLALPSNEALAR